MTTTNLMKSLIAVIMILTLVNCGKKRTAEEIKQAELTANIQNIVSDSILNVIKNLGMPIKEGVNPPNVVGYYKMSPVTLTRTNIQDDYTIGHVFNDLNFHFYNQDNGSLTLNYEDKQNTSTSTGYSSYISGNGSDFSVFIKVIKTDSSGKKADSVIIITGTVTGTGIKDVYYSFFMVNNYGSSTYIPNGKGRIAYDSDGLSPSILNLNSMTQDDLKSGLTEGNNLSNLK